MIESFLRFAGAPSLRLAKGPQRAPEAVILFPGFPGYAPPAGALRAPPKLRVAIARELLSAMDVDAYLPGYPGLEAGGRFTFQAALNAGTEHARALARLGYLRVHVIGHSWGAFVAFNAHRDLGAQAGRLALLSGLLDFPDERSVRAFLPYYFRHFPDVLGEGASALERAAADLDGARRACNPMTLASPMLQDRLLILQGRRDKEIDPEMSRRFHARAGGRLVELDADHGYSGRLAEASGNVFRFMTASRFSVPNLFTFQLHPQRGDPRPLRLL